MAGHRGGRNDGGGTGRGNSGVDLGLELVEGGWGCGRDVEQEGGRSRRGYHCWGASLREIGGSRRSRRARGCERRGVDDLGEMGERSRTELWKGGSRCALAGRGRCQGQDRNWSVVGTKAGHRVPHHLLLRNVSDLNVSSVVQPLVNQLCQGQVNTRISNYIPSDITQLLCLEDTHFCMSPSSSVEYWRSLHWPRWYQSQGDHEFLLS